MSIVIYGDFTCPSCYLASWRAELLDHTVHAVDWRAVAHRPSLPFTGGPAGGPAMRELTKQWAAVASLRTPGETLPGRAPSFLASSQAATAGYAEAYGAGVAERARRVLFQAYWVDGLDIGNPEVLRVLLADTILSGSSSSQPLHEWGYAVTSAHGPITTAASHLIDDWQQQWRDLGSPPEPALVHDRNAVTTGDEALAYLARQVRVEIHHHHGLAPLPTRQLAGAFWT